MKDQTDIFVLRTDWPDVFPWGATAGFDSNQSFHCQHQGLSACLLFLDTGFFKLPFTLSFLQSSFLLVDVTCFSPLRGRAFIYTRLPFLSQIWSTNSNKDCFTSGVLCLLKTGYLLLHLAPRSGPIKIHFKAYFDNSVFRVSHLLSCLKVPHLCVSSWKIPLLNSWHHLPPWPHWFQCWLHFWRTFSIPEETLNCHVIIFFATAFLKYLDSSPMWNFTHFPRFSSNIASSLKSLHSTLTHPYCTRHWKSYNRVLVCMSSIDHKTLWGRHNKWLIFFFPKCLESNKWSASVCWNNTLLFLILSFFFICYVFIVSVVLA